ncbi:MAG: UDP-N-acetylglucosamine 2-epimerase (non-hydrolyzing) [Candidatus Latescibacteria bacterium]|nr:UDP-N-acetylglucosamine 2-epimerase (non-hydrolyzing) [Candidatus Latescibacterota bacterium]
MARPHKVILVVSARPNFMKIAPILSLMALRPNVFEPILVHTGQHYDTQLSGVFFDDLNLPQPTHHLAVGSGSHGQMTGKTMIAFEPVLLQEKADLVLVVGDVNPTLACAVDAAKLHIPVAHVEAGLRSRDRKMPEEINRLVTDAVADFLLTPSRDADANLLAEGIPAEKIFFVGNVMADSLRQAEKSLEQSTVLADNGVAAGLFAYATMHRDFNVDTPQALARGLEVIERVQRQLPVIFAVHPRTRNQIDSFGFADRLAAMTNLKPVAPVNYLDSLRLQRDAALVLTDSAGLQEESTVWQTPCLTMRPNTERPVTVEQGSATIVNLDAELAAEKTAEILSGRYKSGIIPEGWDGRAANRTVDLLAERL